MRMVHVVPHIDQEAAGPSYSVPRLCQALAARGNDVELSCLAARGAIPGVRLDLHPEWPVLRRFALSPALARALRRKAATLDLVHNHSLWSMVNVASGLVVPGHRAKLVTSPRGTLSPWALSRTRHLKRMLRPLQWQALQRADLLHATSEMELNEIRALGFLAPVAVVPNGIDIPEPMSVDRDPVTRTMLFLSRIHPKKGIDRLLRAWQMLESSHPDWRLRIAGRGEDSHVHEVLVLAKELNLSRVDFSGPAFGKEKSNAYFAAELFVFPTHSENFGMVVAEALAHGCAVIASTGTPWEGLVREGCGWWVEHDVPVLAATLDAAMRLPPAQLSDMGQRGRRWMQRDFSWESVAERMEAAYSWMLGDAAGPAPAWIRRDE